MWAFVIFKGLVFSDLNIRTFLTDLCVCTFTRSELNTLMVLFLFIHVYSSIYLYCIPDIPVCILL